MVNDPIGDFIVRLTNAGAAGKSSVVVPFSNLKLAIAEKLLQAGFVASVDKKGKKVKKTIEITLAQKKTGTSRIEGVKRVSKPGRRMYRSVNEIVPVRYGRGALILSTPAGILTDKEARTQNVGGEALFEIW